MADFKDRFYAAVARYLRDEKGLDAVRVTEVEQEKYDTRCGDGTCDYTDYTLEIEYWNSADKPGFVSIGGRFDDLLTKLTDD